MYMKRSQVGCDAGFAMKYPLLLLQGQGYVSPKSRSSSWSFSIAVSFPCGMAIAQGWYSQLIRSKHQGSTGSQLEPGWVQWPPVVTTWATAAVRFDIETQLCEMPRATHHQIWIMDRINFTMYHFGISIVTLRWLARADHISLILYTG